MGEIIQYVVVFPRYWRLRLWVSSRAALPLPDAHHGKVQAFRLIMASSTTSTTQGGGISTVPV